MNWLETKIDEISFIFEGISCIAIGIDAPAAFRTSAHLDLVMKYMERYAINSQMFHAFIQPIDKTPKNFRVFALISNFASCHLALCLNWANFGTDSYRYRISEMSSSKNRYEV